MERSRFSTFGSLFIATVFAGAMLLGGCSDSLTGTAPTAEETVQDSQHNTSNETDPVAGHNTSDED